MRSEAFRPRSDPFGTCNPLRSLDLGDTFRKICEKLFNFRSEYVNAAAEALAGSVAKRRSGTTHFGRNVIRLRIASCLIDSKNHRRQTDGLKYCIIRCQVCYTCNARNPVRSGQSTRWPRLIADTIFHISPSTLAPNLRYIKHLKARNTPLLSEEGSNFLSREYWRYLDS